MICRQGDKWKGSGSNGGEAGAESLCNLKRAGRGSHYQANYTTRLSEINNKKPGLYGKEIKPSVFGENSFEKDSKQLAKLWPWGHLLRGRGSAGYFSRWKRWPFNAQMMTRSNPSSLTSLWGWRWWGPDNSREAVLNRSLLIMALSGVALLRETSPTASGTESSSQLHQLGFLCTPGS